MSRSRLQAIVPFGRQEADKTQVILYDNPSRFGSGTTWSPNVWKTRLLLNFKGIDYKTEWIHGPDVEPTFKSFGIPPHPAKTQIVDYTVPTVRLPDGSYLMESKAIALALETLFPKPSAHLDSPLLAQVEEAWWMVMRGIFPVLVPRMPRECLSGPSIEYHREARKKSFGMSLEELEAKRGGEKAWENTMPGFQKLAEILKVDPSGPFCLGETPSYADFLIVGFLEWCKCLKGDNFERVVGIDNTFQEIYKACEPWLKRNDH